MRRVNKEGRRLNPEKGLHARVAAWLASGHVDCRSAPGLVRVLHCDCTVCIKKVGHAKHPLFLLGFWNSDTPQRVRM